MKEEIDQLFKYAGLDVDSDDTAAQLAQEISILYTSQLQVLRDSVDKISEDSPNMIYKSDVLSLLDTLIKEEE